MKKKFKIEAEVVSYVSLIVEAESLEEAISIAQDADGGEFIEENPSAGEFNILPDSSHEIEEEKNEQLYYHQDDIKDRLMNEGALNGENMTEEEAQKFIDANMGLIRETFDREMNPFDAIDFIVANNKTQKGKNNG